MNALANQKDLDIIALTDINLRELSRYTFNNTIQCMGNNFFNTNGIKQSLLALVSLNYSADSRVFMNLDELRTNTLSREDASPFQPDISPINSFNAGDFANGKIDVAFTDINFGLKPPYKKGEKWISPHIEFFNRIKNLSTRVNPRYFYSERQDESKFSIKDSLMPDTKNVWVYEMFVDMFGDALRSISTFAGREVDLESHRYIDDKNFWKEGDTGRWKGSLEDFMLSAKIIEETIKDLTENYGWKTELKYNAKNIIKLHHPAFGMILSAFKTNEYAIENIYTSKGRVKRHLKLPSTFIFSKNALESMKKDTNITRNYKNQ